MVRLARLSQSRLSLKGGERLLVLAVFFNPPHSRKGQFAYLRCSPHHPQINGYPLASLGSGYPFHRFGLEAFTKLHIFKRTCQRAVRALFEQNAPVWRNSICKGIDPSCECLCTLGNLVISIKTSVLIRKDTNVVWPSHLAAVLASGSYAYFKSGHHENGVGHSFYNNANIGKSLVNGFIREAAFKFINPDYARFLYNLIFNGVNKINTSSIILPI